MSAPGSPTRATRPGLRERNKRDKRARIVRAARELFREQGFDGTTGRQICERAGIGTGTLFLYVRDKRELLFLIFQPLAEGVFAQLPVGLEAGERVGDGLMRLFAAFYRLYGHDPRLASLFLRELFFRSDPGEGMAALNDELRRRIAAIVRDGRDRGELRQDLDPLAQGAAVAAHYLFWLQLWLGTGEIGHRDAEAGLREAIALQLAGVGAPGKTGETGKPHSAPSDDPPRGREEKR